PSTFGPAGVWLRIKRGRRAGTLVPRPPADRLVSSRLVGPIWRSDLLATSARAAAGPTTAGAAGRRGGLDYHADAALERPDQRIGDAEGLGAGGGEGHREHVSARVGGGERVVGREQVAAARGAG